MESGEATEVVTCEVGAAIDDLCGPSFRPPPLRAVQEMQNAAST